MDSFEIWWNKNKDLYALVGVTQEIAKAIWSDAQSEVGTRVLKMIKDHS